MNKLLLFSCLLMFSVACKQNNCENIQGQTKDKASSAALDDACPNPDPTDPTDPNGPTEPIPEPDPGSDVPHEALIFDAKFELHDFDREDEEKVTKAIEIIKKVVGSKEFQTRVLDFTYKGKKQFVDNKGLTNGQIYTVLLDGKEDLKPEVDHEMDLELQLYYSWRSTVGYTYPDGLRIWMNTKFFDYYTPSEVAGNVFHEWTHKLGFDHASSYSVSRDSSVPYALGYLIEELGKKYE